MTVVPIDGQPATIEGAADDAYFANAAGHAAGLAPLAAFVRAQVAPDAVIADVGANIGLSTILLARLVPAGRVLAFEPSPITAGYLRRNLAANGLQNVTVHEAAVGAAPGRAAFEHVSQSAASSRVVGHAGNGSLEVPVVTLDDVAAAEGVTFGFAKIDAEGYEPWIIAGLAGQLRNTAVLPLWLEFNSWALTCAGANAVAFALALTAAFDCQRVEPDGPPSPVTSGLGLAHDNMVQRGCVDDLIARLRPGAAVPGLAALIGQGPRG